MSRQAMISTTSRPVAAWRSEVPGHLKASDSMRQCRALVQTVCTESARASGANRPHTLKFFERWTEPAVLPGAFCMSRSCGASIWTGQLFLFYLTLTAMTSIACTDDGNSQSANRFKPGWCSSVRRRWTHCCVLDRYHKLRGPILLDALADERSRCRLRCQGTGSKHWCSMAHTRATAVNGCIIPRSIRRPSVWRPLRCYMASAQPHTHTPHPAAYGPPVSSCPVRAQRNPRELLLRAPCGHGHMHRGTRRRPSYYAVSNRLVHTPP
jgi:hypothetical protein